MAAFIFPSTLTSLLVPAAEKHPHSLMLPPPCFTVGMVMSSDSFPPDITLDIQAEELNLRFIRPENFISHGLRVFQVPFGKLQAGCHVCFTPAMLELCQSDHQVLSHPPDHMHCQHALFQMMTNQLNLPQEDCNHVVEISEG